MAPAFTLKTEADSSSSSQLTSAANTKIAGNLIVNIAAGTPVLDQITILNYATFSGAFGAISAHSDQNTNYEGRYDNNKAVIVPCSSGCSTPTSVPDPSPSTSTSTGSESTASQPSSTSSSSTSSSTSSGNNDHDNSSSSLKSSLLIISLLLASSLLL